MPQWKVVSQHDRILKIERYCVPSYCFHYVFVSMVTAHASLILFLRLGYCTLWRVCPTLARAKREADGRRTTSALQNAGATAPILVCN